ncbi:MAG: hypothetical protein EKK62_03115 [Acidimicrobiia bacterium]|nr:MAG: hypothetical protein EKK62_03115 [Acidimicrobiia bacterium]
MPRQTIASLLSASLRAVDTSQDDGGLIRYAERVQRRIEGPRALPMYHLAPLASGYERAEQAILARDAEKVPPVFECHHAPVQHGKTTLIKMTVLRILRRNPRAWIAYCAYNADTAIAKMYEVRQLCEAEGIHIDPEFDTGSEFRTREGGGVVAGGIVGGPWTSRGFDLIIIDDPYKTAQDAYSIAWRTAVENAFWTALWTRRRPWTSIIVNAARWHPNDLTGILVKRRWRYVRLPAINDNGCEACAMKARGVSMSVEAHACVPLWPERWTLAELLAIRDGRPANDNAEAIDPVPGTVWASLYQGLPAPDGGRIFEPSAWPTYATLPEGPFREAMGLDLAYGARDRHDHSAHAVGRRYEADRRRIYLAEADDRAEGVELYGCRVAEVQVRRAGGPRLVVPSRADDIDRDWRPQLQREEVKGARRISCRWYTSTTEAGTAALLAGYGARVEAVRAVVDKLARVQAGGYQSAAAEGRILVPARPSPGILRFMKSHEEFTGTEGDFDDPVDAGCAMHDQLAVPVSALGGGGSGRLVGSWGFNSREG